MKVFSLLFACGFSCLLLTSCVFEKPVFTTGFSKVDASLGGVWVTSEKDQDPRKQQFAVFAPLDEERWLLQYPAGAVDDGMAFEARAIQVGGRVVLQLRAIASFAEGLPKPDAKIFTLLWVEKQKAPDMLQVRALDGDISNTQTPEALRALLEEPSAKWESFFGEPMLFRRLP